MWYLILTTIPWDVCQQYCPQEQESDLEYFSPLTLAPELMRRGQELDDVLSLATYVPQAKGLTFKLYTLVLL